MHGNGSLSTAPTNRVLHTRFHATRQHHRANKRSHQQPKPLLLPIDHPTEGSTQLPTQAQAEEVTHNLGVYRESCLARSAKAIVRTTKTDKQTNKQTTNELPIQVQMPRILLEGLPCASSRATAPGSEAATSTNKQTFAASHSHLTINLSVLLAFCCHCCCVDSESISNRFSIDVESTFNRFFLTVMLTVH